ncbi:MAG TPA: gamma-glutamyltransferase [Acidimicrobiales bacterium]|nr:gamma-glutamyltransferase [Acidimicrobiales bacterium]
MVRAVPFHPRVAVRGMVTTADQLASSTGIALLERGGSAGDAIVAAAAVMAVVGPHLCGPGGDVLAVVSAPAAPPVALLAVGRAGSGADPARLRAEGHNDMPQRGDIRSVPVPGAVDGWMALHERYGRVPWDAVLEPAIALAEDGFAASLLLAFASHLVAGVPGASQLCPNGPLREHQLVRLPGMARTLRALAAEGRDGFYGGEFGRALLGLGDGEYTADDLARPLAQWTEPLTLRAFGHDLWTVPPPSQGYLTLAGAWIAEQVALPADPTDPLWPHLVAEASRAASFDRPSVLHDGADGDALLSLERLGARAATVDPERAGSPRPSGIPSRPGAAALSDGDTTHLCAVDAEGLGISLTQSNALDFGTHLVAGETGVFLHNRGVGFSLEPGHPAEYGAGRRPTHTLCPTLVTRPDGSLAQIVGTMGGDAQPQILLQLLARLLHTGEDAADAISAARVVHEAPGAPPFRLWQAPARSLVMESNAPERWHEGLESRGHRVRVIGAFNPVDVGCSQIISVEAGDGHLTFTGASDPRSPDGDVVGR